MILAEKWLNYVETRIIMEELDLKNLIQILAKKWWIIIISAIICAAAAAVISIFFLTPVYQSNTTLYIGKRIDTNTDMSYNDILLGSQLVKDYRELAKSRVVAEAVIQELNLKDMTVDQLSARLDVTLKNDTRVIQITAEDKDPKLACDIANKVSEVFQKKVVDIMKVENVSVIDVAVVPESPVRPNKKMITAVAFALGLLLSAGIILLIDYFDNTVKTPEDIKKYIDIPVIGTIPVFPE